MEANKIYARLFTPHEKISEYDILTTFKPQYGNYDVFLEAKKHNLKTVTHVIHEYQKSESVIASFKNRVKSSLPLMVGHMQRFIIENSDVVIATSEAEKELIMSNYRVSSNAVVVVPNSVNVNIFMEDHGNLFTEKYGINDPYILMVGRIEKNKNQLNVLRAVVDDEVQVVILGKPGNDTTYYEQVYSYPNCRIISDIEYSSADLASAFQNAAVFILPSFREISPNTIIEAVLSNSNVISTENTVSMRSYFGDDIEYINPKDIKGIRNTIHKYLYQGFQNNYSRSKVADIFSADRIIDQHISIYKTLLHQT
jgi:glycosyltransferase involved in cell wall biosynthesis